MDKFIPKAKLSKKAKRERAKAQRQTWGGINPVTRKPKNPDAYVREKPRYESDDDTGAFYIHRYQTAALSVIARSIRRGDAAMSTAPSLSS
jgi:hypothetical protein